METSYAKGATAIYFPYHQMHSLLSFMFLLKANSIKWTQLKVRQTNSSTKKGARSFLLLTWCPDVWTQWSEELLKLIGFPRSQHAGCRHWLGNNLRRLWIADVWITEQFSTVLQKLQSCTDHTFKLHYHCLTVAVLGK